MTEREQREFWRLRRGVGEAVKKLGPYAEEDCAVPAHECRTCSARSAGSRGGAA